jgi:twitching motility protein PilT
LSVEALQVTTGRPLLADTAKLPGREGAVVSRSVMLQLNDCDAVNSASRAVAVTVKLPAVVGMALVTPVEVLIATAFIRDCIIDKEKTHLINSAIAQGTSQYGMQTFDQSIFGLFQQGFISLEEALRWASNVDEFKLKVQGISTTADAARD